MNTNAPVQGAIFVFNPGAHFWQIRIVLFFDATQLQHKMQEEGRRKKEEGRRKKEEGRRKKKEERRKKKEEGRRK